jgi:hypothetical protein
MDTDIKELTDKYNNIINIIRKDADVKILFENIKNYNDILNKIKSSKYYETHIKKLNLLMLKNTMNIIITGYNYRYIPVINDTNIKTHINYFFHNYNLFKDDINELNKTNETNKSSLTLKINDIQYNLLENQIYLYGSLIILWDIFNGLRDCLHIYLSNTPPTTPPITPLTNDEQIYISYVKLLSNIFSEKYIEELNELNKRQNINYTKSHKEPYYIELDFTTINNKINKINDTIYKIISIKNKVETIFKNTKEELDTILVSILNTIELINTINQNIKGYVLIPNKNVNELADNIGKVKNINGGKKLKKEKNHYTFSHSKRSQIGNFSKKRVPLCSLKMRKGVKMCK